MKFIEAIFYRLYTIVLNGWKDEGLSKFMTPALMSLLLLMYTFGMMGLIYAFTGYKLNMFIIKWLFTGWLPLIYIVCYALFLRKKRFFTISEHYAHETLIEVRRGRLWGWGIIIFSFIFVFTSLSLVIMRNKAGLP